MWNLRPAGRFPEPSMLLLLALDCAAARPRELKTKAAAENVMTDYFGGLGSATWANAATKTTKPNPTPTCWLWKQPSDAA